MTVSLASENHKTVYVAMGANVVIAVAKAVAGVFTGSSAMLAEAAHSTADTMNEVFMLISFALSRRPADEQHPFGYGKERFFWAFLAAVFIFVSGAAFSIIEGVRSLLSEGSSEIAPTKFFIASYVVLAVAFVSEGTSFLRALRQTRRGASEARLGFVQYMRHGKEPVSKVVLLEDSAALIGILTAATGLGLYQYTGQHVYDALASIVIGLLLAVDALIIGSDAKGLLLGEAALPKDQEAIERIIREHDGIAQVIQVLTLAIGPQALLVTARVHLEPNLDSDDIERAAFEVDKKLRAEVPNIREVFLDPTNHREPKHSTRPSGEGTAVTAASNAGDEAWR